MTFVMENIVADGNKCNSGFFFYMKEKSGDYAVMEPNSRCYRLICLIHSGKGFVERDI